VSESYTAASRLLLPEHVRLFHIGPPKTGTTAIQSAARVRRAEMLAAGVLYPGRHRSHRAAISAFMERGFGWREEGERAGKSPSISHWNSLMDEVDQETERRIWFGHEFAAAADDELAARWIEAIGPRAHVVITLRAFSRMLPSMWQENLKLNGHRAPFDRWLSFAVDPDTRTGKTLRKRHDHGALVQRWAAAAGPENVTVVVLDARDHSFVFNSFEGLLGLPEGLLATAEVPDRGMNRSMSTAEIELFRKLNVYTRKHGLNWDEHAWLVYDGAINRLLQAREPGPTEGKLGLPDFAAEFAHRQEERNVELISTSGVRVLGDLANLVEPVRARTKEIEDHRTIDTVPLDVALESLIGVIAAATGRDATFEHSDKARLRKARVDLKSEGASIQVASRSLVERARDRLARHYRSVKYRLKRH
jgi:hypothetical protein